jgi:hypothetical protein
MMADALARKFDVVVVHKLDRFSRNLRITLEYFDKLLEAGVAFVSINEQIDFTTPSGKVHLALLGAFAQYYSDNLSQETKKGWAERRAQGLYCGLLPFGAIKGEDGVQSLTPKPTRGFRWHLNWQHRVNLTARWRKHSMPAGTAPLATWAIVLLARTRWSGCSRIISILVNYPMATGAGW